ncbi:purine-nucleoside phosphorylase [Fusibacter paucivorans]|uniref:Purine nucleoside phosphorylase DeoD-type n=1 Tax=Fusibacter paucivorans TaxID=76009 RepID=A0ABS5PST9_9FIRM|nr:purine-nucleoside phosphorylase [Fusibacter paucivorans]MBS7528233.1 purine-nucleoside phosphorylase [Fusibacter paucivorans]
MSTHINAKLGDIADIVLLPGDPMRAKYIAETFLEKPQCYNTVRGMFGYTGTYNGVRISVQGTGMGMPSLSIYVNELLRFYDVKTLIRVGSCGAMQPEVKIRDIILAQAACTTSNMNNRRFPNTSFAPIATFDLLYRTYQEGTAKGYPIHVGNILSEDSFYDDANSNRNQQFIDYGILAVEMEAAELYTLAAKYHADALCVLTVSDSLVTSEETSAEEREKTFNEMITLVLDTVSASEIA